MTLHPVLPMSSSPQHLNPNDYNTITSHPHTQDDTSTQQHQRIASSPQRHQSSTSTPQRHQSTVSTPQRHLSNPHSCLDLSEFSTNSHNDNDPRRSSSILSDDEVRSGWRRGEVHIDVVNMDEPVLEVVLRPLMVLLRVVGVGPPGWDATTGKYMTGWQGAAAVARGIAAAFLITLSAVACFSIARKVLELDVVVEENKAVRGLKTVGVVIVGGYQVNACVQVATMLAFAPCHARLLTAWTRLTLTHHIQLPPRTRLRCYLQLVFMLVFIAAMLTAAAFGQPRLLAVVLDGLAERLYLIPQAWLPPASSTTGVRVGVALIALHQFAINKGVLFYFTIHCHLLTAALATWNTHLSHALNEVWAGGWRGAVGGGVGGLVGGLVGGRQMLVDMVRDTQGFFSPILQCYFASTVVIVCTELYLLAQGVGSGLLRPGEVAVLVLLTLQTTGLLIHVSLAASAVQEQAEASGDVLCRGLPYTATPQDKFYIDQLTRALTISPLYITGGNFFTINRSFILTVVSVVASYFIVILQFTQSCGQQEETQCSTNSTLTHINSTLHTP